MRERMDKENRGRKKGRMRKGWDRGNRGRKYKDEGRMGQREQGKKRKR